MTTLKNSNLVQIKILLEPMGDVNYVITKSTLLLKKDNITFGKINNDNIYLIDNTGTFQKLKPSILKDKDKFLKAATQAYWTASGKTSKVIHQL